MGGGGLEMEGGWKKKGGQGRVKRAEGSIHLKPNILEKLGIFQDDLKDEGKRSFLAV